MRARVDASELVSAGLAPERAQSLANVVSSVLGRHASEPMLASQERAWTELTRGALADPLLPFDVSLVLYRRVYEGRDAKRDGPGPAWIPTPEEIQRTQLATLMAEVGLPNYAALHRWSLEHREEFWNLMLKRLRVPFQQPPQRVLDPSSDVRAPRWLPGARLNIADTCFQAERNRTVILYGREGTEALERITYGELEALTNRVARGLDALGLGPHDRVALYLPMTPESVAAYFGIIKSGRCAVGIADASAPPDVEKRLEISNAQLVITIDRYLRDGKELRVYEKAQQAHAPRTVVIPSEGHSEVRTPLRPGDLPWDKFLAPDVGPYASAARAPSDPTNILFSSGTTKEPKAIVWTHTTPLKCLMDAHFHHDVHADDVLAWPTSFGWMMGPWLAYAALGHGATMALYNGSPLSRGFGRFVETAGVTLLGVVPKLVHAWKTQRTLEGLNWRRIRRLSSTGETSDPEEMLWLMAFAGWKPVIEYCGGTEIGGGYLTGTMVQPAAPATFTTPSLGLDFYLLDEAGRPTDRGEVGLVPPSIGLSNELLNYDHRKEYFDGFIPGPKGEILRRHGDQVERLGATYFRHHGRMDDTINLNGVKTSVEELRGIVGHHPLAYDTKPIAVDVEGKGQHVLVVYVIPRDPTHLNDAVVRETLRKDFERMIRERLNPLLGHVHDVVLAAELPQAGPGKTRTMKEFVKDYRARRPSTTAAASHRG